MKKHDLKIIAFRDSLKKQIVDVWEQSVSATHNFLKPDDFEGIKKLVTEMDFSAFDLRCLMHNDKVIGFVGVAGKKVEMLFLLPDYFGQGLGKKLMNFAYTELGASEVDVNEQNTDAVAFYKKIGYKIYERTDKDEQKRDYPILKMKRKTNKPYGAQN
ncbi:GNAT family N-acetyltransferase [Maribellus comscasis]|uniref:GNAT family N-acetyltransferase n=1 Tax=Maribellus comscasis TaxID=2681766 RepID=A0A6I6K3X6_9BACT|nr:GNAT family N-acetyltransferase [Maribellus comscasis]QGY46303.1 GNAT family N-acetyltransferase [Maribellus comscasis]